MSSASRQRKQSRGNRQAEEQASHEEVIDLEDASRGPVHPRVDGDEEADADGQRQHRAQHEAQREHGPRRQVQQVPVANGVKQPDRAALVRHGQKE